MKHLFLFLLLLFTLKISAQSVSGIIHDEQNQPIEYAHVYIANRYLGVYTFSNGSFLIKNETIQSRDTLTITYIGYHSKNIILQANNDKFDIGIIQLSPKVNQLPLLTVIPAKRLITVGNDERRGEKSGFLYGQKRLVSYEVGLFIPNDSSYTGTIETVSFFVSMGNKPKTPFRVRIYSVGVDGSPKEDLLTKSVIARAKKAKQWVTVDLSSYQITIPPEGFFVVMEWLYRPEKQFNKKHKVSQKKSDGTKKINNEIWFGQHLGGIIQKEEAPNHTWFAINKHWVAGKKFRISSSPSIKAQLRVR